MSPISDLIYREDDSICVSFSYSLVKRLILYVYLLFGVFRPTREILTHLETVTWFINYLLASQHAQYSVKNRDLKKPIPEDPYIFDTPVILIIIWF